MTPYMWAMVFLAGAVALVVLEMFIPSAGLLGVLALSSLITSIGFVYYYRGFLEGTVYLATMSLLIPIALTSALKYWPYTPIGRRILNVDPEGYREQVESPFTDLVGKQGVSVTKMLLSGSIRVEGRLYDAVSDGMALEADQPIEVVDVRGNRILVRPVDATSDAADVAARDPLARPASEIIGDAFDDPLA